MPRAKGCKAIGISLGIPFFPPSMNGGMGRAVDKAYEERAIIVVAGGQIIDSVTYPGKYWRTIGGTRQGHHEADLYRTVSSRPNRTDMSSRRRVRPAASFSTTVSFCSSAGPVGRTIRPCGLSC
jgi:hypothetical protein